MTSNHANTVRNLLRDVLQGEDISSDKVHSYFHDDVHINIMGREFFGLEEFTKRLVWLKDHAEKKVEIVSVFANESGDQVFDRHLVQVEVDGRVGKVLTFGHYLFKGEKVQEATFLEHHLEGNLPGDVGTRTHQPPV